MSAKHLVKNILPTRWRHRIREHLVPVSVTRISGPKTVPLSRRDAVVTCVVKNGEFYIKSFIEHYSRLGFRHIFFMDNGSNDETVSIAQRYANVSICQSTLPIDTYQPLFKKYLAQSSAQGGWCLDADIDELFDYPSSDVISLGDFLEYLNRRQYTAVLTQLLDMFSDCPLSSSTVHQSERLSDAYGYYDISDVTKTPYRIAELGATYGSKNRVSNPETALYFGGIRKTLYGNNCLLTKHSLFRPEKQLELFPHVHFVDGAGLADVSCVMMHYKLTNKVREVTLQNKDGFVGISKTYEQFIDFLTNNPGYQIKQHTAVKFKSVGHLVNSGFLFVSDEYREYVGTTVGQTHSKM